MNNRELPFPRVPLGFARFSTHVSQRKETKKRPLDIHPANRSIDKIQKKKTECQSVSVTVSSRNFKIRQVRCEVPKVKVRNG